MNSLVIYPNPAHTLLNVETGSATQSYSFKLIDVMDRTKLAWEQTGSKKIDIQSLPTGIYILKMQGEDRSVQIKFIKE